ncbi:MAG: GNAT family N-acetyltransferase [Thermomicrobiales bacterium]|nr:GNAT family N-acetyltransferase [Thermomicrobiales bacterium]
MHANAQAAEPPARLVGERVIVRAWHFDDARPLFEAVTESRDRLRPWMSWVDIHQTVADSVDYCHRVGVRFDERSDFALGIWHRESGRLLGGTGLHNINWDVPSFEVGYWLRDGEVGKGYVEEAVRLLVRHAFTRMGANRLALTCDANNDRSRRIPERIGFVLEGRLRNHLRTEAGALRDTLIYALTPGDAAAGV